MNKIFTFLLLFFMVFSGKAKNQGNTGNPPSERAMFKQAERYFVKREYLQAAPLYEQLVKAYPDNYKLNYGYGICLLITSKDKAEAVRFLEEASKSVLVWDDVWYYLGRAYQLNNEFEKAISAYDQFLKMVSIKQELRWEAMHQIEMCKNAEIMVKNPDSLSFLETKLIKSNEQNAAYVFGSDKHKLEILPDEYMVEKDRSNPACGQMFISKDGSKMVFTSYGKEIARTTDLFYAEKNSNGSWDKPVRMNATINTKYDEAYPTFSDDGEVLYFSSKGHNSMGGFDIFRSEYYPQLRQWSKPENMEEPVNSSDDDFYYLADEDENIAYFSSKRETNTGEAHVYKIALNNDAQGKILIIGEVNNEYAAPFRQATVVVTRQTDGEVITSFTSNAVNGKYRFTLPRGDVYRMSVKIEGFGPMAQAVTFTSNVSGKVYQTINVSKDTLGYDKLAILNSFVKKQEKENLAVPPVVNNNDDTPPVVNNNGDTPAVIAQETEQPGTADEPGGTTGNQKLSTGYEPITMYAEDGLPPVSDVSKEKLSVYFAKFGNKDFKMSGGPLNQNEVKEKGSFYKVQLGTFMHQTIEEVYKKLVEMGFNEISYYTNKKGWIIFYSGHTPEITSALKLKDIIINYGFSDAFITVFENGKPARVKKK